MYPLGSTKKRGPAVGLVDGPYRRPLEGSTANKKQHPYDQQRAIVLRSNTKRHPWSLLSIQPLKAPTAASPVGLAVSKEEAIDSVEDLAPHDQFPLRPASTRAAMAGYLRRSSWQMEWSDPFDRCHLHIRF